MKNNPVQARKFPSSYRFYNEEANLPPPARACSPSLDGLGMENEVILVDDGSRDRSLGIISSLHLSIRVG